MTTPELPPLPEHRATTLGLGRVWNRDDMRAYALAYGALCAEAARKQALDEAYDAMFDIKGDKVTRFDAQTAIRSMAARKGTDHAE